MKVPLINFHSTLDSSLKNNISVEVLLAESFAQVALRKELVICCFRRALYLPEVFCKKRCS